jgi:hypothetical protein
MPLQLHLLDPRTSLNLRFVNLCATTGSGNKLKSLHRRTYAYTLSTGMLKSMLMLPPMHTHMPVRAFYSIFHSSTNYGVATSLATRTVLPLD